MLYRPTHSERRTTRTHNGQLRCVHSTPEISHFSSLFDFISVYKRQENSKTEHIGECQAFLISLVNSMLCDAICARQAGRQAALCIDSEQVRVEIYWFLLSNSSTWFRLLLHFGWPFFLWGFGFSKVGVEKRLCVAPSWCWVMTAHSFVVASPYIPAQFRSIWLMVINSLYHSISPLLSSQHIFYLTYSLASVRKTIENILGNCAAQR